eukprot:jgi/Picsp_1/2616/NSC_00846-R1_es43 protein
MPSRGSRTSRGRQFQGNSRAKSQDKDSNGSKYQVGDSVILQKKPGAIKDEIALIMNFVQDSGSKVLVQRFLPPEEIFGEKQAFHGERELLKLQQFDIASINDIQSKCHVVTLEQYQMLPEEMQKKSYYFRMAYCEKSRSFIPERTRVFCKCRMPYNPDKRMIFCTECHEWFHVDCLVECGELENGGLFGLYRCAKCQE